MKYHIWTSGCQMNVADSRRVASALEGLNYQSTPKAEDADVIVLNTCVVRQSAEDSAVGRINSLKNIKIKRPDAVINVMGCLVGIKGTNDLQEQFPHVDVFSAPSDPGPLMAYLTQEESKIWQQEATSRRFAFMDGDLTLPEADRAQLVSAFVPVVLGCSHACTYCIIPYRRGIERSRPVVDVVNEVSSLASQGVKEITLLGQIVDRYGLDLPEQSSLPELLSLAHEIEGVDRIRFLTSHPNWFSTDLMDTVSSLPKLMPHIEVPHQAGDDQVLQNMKREYSVGQYRQLVGEIRDRIPGVSIATDVIVGFPGETREQFQNSYDVLKNLKLDVVHLARYSVRPGTVAARKMDDDVAEDEKWQRFRLIEELQEGIAAEINQKYLGETVEVLFEGKNKERWRGRTPTNKLVFVESEYDLLGTIQPVKITWTGPWSMQGNIPPGDNLLKTNLE
ncbi:MAG: tRNA (N6-isopentenyl adenosine(37)-C2)-methylthiotransferase MiaB [Anaerolineales bacterium]|nr:tRNA (N6-isopentenyl adenosine(37)-C2)-methylthiotransferase MiaB [Anaerolineales bacterium]